MRIDRQTYAQHVLTVPHGSTVFREGDAGDQMYVIVDGGVEIRKATSATATFFVACASFLQYCIQGKVPTDFGGLLFVTGAVATLFCQHVIVPYIKQSGKTYLYVAALGLIMFLSLALLLAAGVWKTVSFMQHDGDLGFGDICPAGAELGTS